MFASWKKSENARSTVPCSVTASPPTAAASVLAADATRAGHSGERANPLLELEELRPFLLDQHAPEQIAEQAHVGAQRMFSTA